MLQHLCQGKGPASQTRNRNDTLLHLSAYCYSHLKYPENGSKEEWDIGWTWELEYTGDHNKMNRLERTNRKELRAKDSAWAQKTSCLNAGEGQGFCSLWWKQTYSTSFVGP